jgi:hypothetical protein
VTQTVSRTASGSTSSPPPKLLELLESGELDWDSPEHREAYLRAWVNGALPPPKRTEPGPPAG